MKGYDEDGVALGLARRLIAVMDQVKREGRPLQFPVMPPPEVKYLALDDPIPIDPETGLPPPPPMFFVTVEYRE